MKTLVLGLTAFVFAGVCLAQSTEKAPEPPPRFYKLEFVVKELEAGKLIGSRSYSIAAGTSDRTQSSVRTGDKIAVPSSPGSAQWTYLDIGVNIDCRVITSTGNELVMQVSADITSAVERTGALAPTIAQTRWNAVAAVPLRKPTIVFSSDGVSNKRQTQLEVTATPLQ